MSPRAPHNRLLLSLSILCCCVSSLVVATSYNYGFDVTKAMKAKRQSGGIVVTKGMPINRDGTIPVRVEIRDLQQDPDKWALYILAMDMMQFTDQSDETSWYGILGTLHSVHCCPCPWFTSILVPKLIFVCLPSSQVSTAYLLSPGAVSSSLLAIFSLDFAHMRVFSFQHGIVRTWLCTRYVHE